MEIVSCEPDARKMIEQNQPFCGLIDFQHRSDCTGGNNYAVMIDEGISCHLDLMFGTKLTSSLDSA